MNNAEKSAEVFGYDLPIKFWCTCWNDEKAKAYCDKECSDKPMCYGWATAEYKGAEGEQ